jgi:hypothetical protein
MGDGAFHHLFRQAQFAQIELGEIGVLWLGRGHLGQLFLQEGAQEVSFR